MFVQQSETDMILLAFLVSIFNCIELGRPLVNLTILLKNKLH